MMTEKGRHWYRKTCNLPTDSQDSKELVHVVFLKTISTARAGEFCVHPVCDRVVTILT